MTDTEKQLRATIKKLKKENQELKEKIKTMIPPWPIEELERM
jgi:cell division protein FtsB